MGLWMKDLERCHSPRVWHALLLVLLTACGGAVSTDERWNADADPEPLLAPEALDCPSAVPAASTGGCESEAAPIYGYHYASPPEFWLGSQAERGVEVSGAGYFVSDDAATSEHAVRFASEARVSVGPDGNLEDHGGHALLGYAPTATGPCVVRLKAPIFSPPQATSSIWIRANLDPRAPIETFDIVEPSRTSNSSTSQVVIDSLGALHLVDFYFHNLGGNLYEYDVVSDGSDVEGGTPGFPTLISVGTLQFTSDGALYVATTPPLSISFAGGATANQPIEIDFGPDIAFYGGSGYGGSTSFASDTFIWSQTSDGFVAGTGSDVRISFSGEVSVEFDTGASLSIGTLALARFPNEDRLEAADDGSLRAKPESGPAQYGVPDGPGRGPLSVPPR
jgi:flagellar hook protein FlgE